MTLQGKQLENFVMGRRATEKARAPLATVARNAIKKATAKLVKKHGGDSLMITAHNANGDQINGHQACALLQAGNSVLLRLTHCVRAGADFFDAGEYKVAGEVVVKLDRPALG